MLSITITPLKSEHHNSVRRILTAIGWAEQYVQAAVDNAVIFSQSPDTLAAYTAQLENDVVGFIYVQYYAWNRLAQIQGLAVDPTQQRKGVALALVQRAEAFARSKQARGVYVDTPTLNTGGRAFYEAAGYRLGYIMPRYYEDQLDGVTYQKFFD